MYGYGTVCKFEIKSGCGPLYQSPIWVWNKINKTRKYESTEASISYMGMELNKMN